MAISLRRPPWPLNMGMTGINHHTHTNRSLTSEPLLWYMHIFKIPFASQTPLIKYTLFLLRVVFQFESLFLTTKHPSATPLFPRFLPGQRTSNAVNIFLLEKRMSFLCLRFLHFLPDNLSLWHAISDLQKVRKCPGSPWKSHLYLDSPGNLLTKFWKSSKI